MATSTSLPIIGFRNEPVPNRLLGPDEATDALAVLLPGFGYTLDMPLFSYAENLLLERGWDVLRVEYAYDRLPEAEVSPRSKLAESLYADSTAAWRAALGQHPYERVALIGKSLGTLAMGHLLTAEPASSPTRAVWLTPILSEDRLREKVARFGGPSLFVIGTDDPHYDPEIVQAMIAATSGEAVVIDGADHGMDILGDPITSVRALERVIAAIGQFI